MNVIEPLAPEDVTRLVLRAVASASANEADAPQPLAYR
jgi:hypothetical protein